MIPQEKSAAVTHGLHQAFGVADFDDIRDLTERPGSNRAFRMVVRGSAYLLRINTRLGDMAQHFTCMQAAAEAGLAPRVWYTSVEDRLAITDFVEAVPFSMTDALTRLPRVLRTLHALPPFPTRANHLNTSCTFLLTKGAAVDGFLQSFQAANVLPKAESEELFARYEQVAAVYPRHDPDMVSSHNDLFRPNNILFDGHRAWLVDWEAAFLNDRYADLAVVANFVVTNDAEEAVYLHEYFGQPPDQYQRARFFLMQQVAHMFYAMGFLWLGSLGGPVRPSEKVPAFRDFHRRIWAGEINLADNQMKTVYGMVHWEQLVQNLGQARFNESLRIVSDRHACP